MADYKQCSDMAQKGPGVTPGSGSAVPPDRRAPSTNSPSAKTSPNSSKRGSQG